MMKNKPIKKIKNITIDELAIMVAKGFQSLTGNIGGIKDEVGKVRSEIKASEERLGGRISGLERRIDDIALNRATKDEVYTLGLRVSKLEKKIGL